MSINSMLTKETVMVVKSENAQNRNFLGVDIVLV